MAHHMFDSSGERCEVSSLTSLDCGGCPVAGHGCGDCPVSFLLGREPDDAIVYDHTTERALRLLRDGGLLGEVVATAVGAGA